MSTAMCCNHEDREATYAPSPCLCPTMCKECAMKMATGGKCKKCGGLFAEVRCIDKKEGEEQQEGPPLERARSLFTQKAIRRRSEPGGEDN